MAKWLRHRTLTPIFARSNRAAVVSKIFKKTKRPKWNTQKKHKKKMTLTLANFFMTEFVVTIVAGI